MSKCTYGDGGTMVDRVKWLTVAAGLALAGAGAAASAQNVVGQNVLGSPFAGASGASAVATFYSNWNAHKIWFRNGTADPAVVRLGEILRRAPFDGFAAGPQLAAQVDAAVRQAGSGKAEDIAAAERVLSTAWVDYVSAIKQPTRNMIYAYEVLKPQGARPDQVLLTAAAAPSLTAYLNS